MKHKILWVEDGAYAELQNMSAPIYVSGKYDLTIALDATDGLRHLAQKEKQFGTIIVDIRLPPGKDQDFIKNYIDKGESKIAARLGLALLERVLKNGEDIPAYHREPERFGVFTVEGRNEFGLGDDLRSLGIKVYHQKTEYLDKNELLDIIEEIRRQNVHVKG